MPGISDWGFRTADSGSAILDFGFHIPHSAFRNGRGFASLRLCERPPLFPFSLAKTPRAPRFLALREFREVFAPTG